MLLDKVNVFSLIIGNNLTIGDVGITRVNDNLLLVGTLIIGSAGMGIRRSRASEAILIRATTHVVGFIKVIIIILSALANTPYNRQHEIDSYQENDSSDDYNQNYYKQ